MKLKTKFEKHAVDDEKRKTALNEKVRVKTNQSEIIKQALSTSSLYKGLGKKIIFEDNEENVDETYGHRNGQEKPVLFDEASSEENYVINEKPQFRGKKGFELLKLQSTYGNDDRFKIDERFLEENEPEGECNERSEPEGRINVDEKNRQLELLDDLLGKSPATRKPKKRTFEMIRYDVSNKDHEKYEIKQDQTEAVKLETVKKKKSKKSKLREAPQYNPKPVVNASNEKFYEVSENIIDSFRVKANSPEGFSLLQIYGQNNSEENEVVDEEQGNEEQDDESIRETEEEPENKVKSLGEKAVDNNGSKPNADKQGDTQSPVTAVAKGVWKESFFFTPDDPRLQEGFEFINKKDSPEAVAAAENYDVTRRKLREIIRLHNKKQMSKKNPFKNKVGGMNKLQMGNSKSKPGSKPKRVFHKKGPPKMNPSGRKF